MDVADVGDAIAAAVIAGINAAQLNQQQAAAAAAQAQQQAAAAAAAIAAAALPPPDPRIAAAIAAMNPVQAAAAAQYHELIDQETAEGRKQWASATTGLTTKYDGSAVGLRAFMAKLGLRARKNAWIPLLFSITTGPNETKSLILEHGQISIEQVNAQAAATYSGLPTRMNQAAEQLYEFLSDSLDDATLLKMMDRQYQYVVNGVLDGPSMLKVLLMITSINTRATVSVLRNELTKLPAKMESLGSDVTEFNAYVNSVLTELRAHGAQVEDLLTKLFGAYQTTDDKDFNDNIKRLESDWEENAINLTVEQLMNHADGKYRTLVQKGTWKAPTKEGEKLIALTAAYEAMVASTKKKDELDKVPTKIGKRGKEGRASSKEWEWKLVAPTGSQPKTKTFKGKHYVYCPHHAKTKWVLAEGHKDGCSLAKDAGEDKTKKTKLPTKEERKYARALMTVMSDEEDDEGEEIILDEDL